MDVHDLNRAYEHRDELRLTEEERSLILRSAVALGSSGPCWGLLRLGEDDALRALAVVVLDDSRPEVCRGAAEELGPTGLQAVADGLAARGDIPPTALYERMLQDDDTGVQRAALTALARSGFPETRELLRNAAIDGPFRSQLTSYWSRS